MFCFKTKKVSFLRRKEYGKNIYPGNSFSTSKCKLLNSNQHMDIRFVSVSPCSPCFSCDYSELRLEDRFFTVSSYSTVDLFWKLSSSLVPIPAPPHLRRDLQSLRTLLHHSYHHGHPPKCYLPKCRDSEHPCQKDRWKTSSLCSP